MFALQLPQPNFQRSGEGFVWSESSPRWAYLFIVASTSCVFCFLEGELVEWDLRFNGPTSEVDGSSLKVDKETWVLIVSLELLSHVNLVPPSVG